MNDIKKVLIAAICVVLAVAIAAGVSIGVLAGTVNGMKDQIAELNQTVGALESQNSAMKAEIEEAAKNNEDLVSAAEFEAKLAEALGAQTQTMQSLISTAVKNQIEELGVEGLTEAQVQQIIDAAVANCLTEDDIDAIVADANAGLTKDEVKKLITDYTAGYLTYGQIVNLIEDETYALRAFLEKSINKIKNELEGSINDKTSAIYIDAEDVEGDTFTINDSVIEDLVGEGLIELVGDWSEINLVINYTAEKRITVWATEDAVATLNNKVSDKATFMGAVLTATVSTVAELEEALYYWASEITVTDDIVLEKNQSIVVEEGVYTTIDLGDNKIVGQIAKDEGAVIENNGDLTLIGGTIENTEVNGDAIINNTGSLTLDGATVKGAPIGETGYPAYAIYNSGNITAEAGTEVISDRGAINTSAGEIIINGGDYIVTSAASDAKRTLTLHTIYVEDDAVVTIYDGNFENNYSGVSGASVLCPAGGDITVYGGSFSDAEDKTDNFNYTANIQNYMGYSSSDVEIYGGTFDDSSVKKNVADGYVALEDGNGKWLVLPEGSAIVASSDALNSAMTNGGTAIIMLETGEYSFKNDRAIEGNFTFIGGEDVVIDLVTSGAYFDKATLAFENVSFKTKFGYPAGGGSDYLGLYAYNATFTNCNFDGSYLVGRDGQKYINCTFDLRDSGDYIRLYGNACTFENCTFETDGKAILAYADGMNGTLSTVEIKDCVFNATKAAQAGAITNQNCAAIEIDNYGEGINLVLSGNTYDKDCFSGEWRIKSYTVDNSGNKDVTVNGTAYAGIFVDGVEYTVVDKVATKK